MAEQIVHRFTAQQLNERYGISGDGPFLESDNVWTLDHVGSIKFEEVELILPEGVELTEKLIQKVMEAWVERNLANQEFVRGLQKFYINGKKPNKTSFFQSLEMEEPSAVRFNQAFTRVQKAMAGWELYKTQGYQVTIIK